jgi:hypothetical protein
MEENMFSKKIFPLAIILGLLFALTACDNKETTTIDEPTTTQVNDELTELTRALPSPADSISDEIAEGLKFMREEEKLARDVYITLNQTHNLRVFANIARSEQIHMNAVKFLLNRYGIEDPVTDNTVGVFTNQDLQALYTALVAQGNTSVIEALKVGGAIEEIDILDLFERIDISQDYPDIVTIYGRLEKGSENHLRAFVRNLAWQGVTYTPQYLSQEVYDEIINGGHVPPVPVDTTLTAEQKAALQFMREEEKLARDVYITFHNQYGLIVFRNISRSEQAHMNAIKRLLNIYNVEDPVGDNGVGVFTNQDLQTLYNALIEQGSNSVIDALSVGAAIEEIDILDLFERIELTRDFPIITRVFSHLEKGSENHLRAFVRNLSWRGVTYEPQYLDEETYNDIINP